MPERPLTADVVEIALIAAMDDDGVIGADGGMPWHVPADLRYFRRKTMHKPIVMGRRTFEAIGRALPRRRNLVLSRDPGFAADGCERVASLDDAKQIAAAYGAAQLMVIGGAQVYALAMPQMQRMYITRIHAHYGGDTFFPAVDWSQWQLVEREDHDAENGTTPAHSFMEWRR